MLQKVGPVLEKLAEGNGIAQSQRLEYWRQARQAYLLQREQFVKMKDAKQLSSSEQTDTIDQALARCDAKIKTLTTTTPSATSRSGSSPPLPEPR